MFQIQRKQFVYSVFVGIACLCILLAVSKNPGYIQNRIIQESRPEVTYVGQNRHDDNDVWKLEQSRRIKRIQETCNNVSLFKDKKNNGGKYLYSSKYNLSYCKVPKVGSSFWTQAFVVLNNGAKVAEKVFGMSRKTVHHSLTPGRVQFDSEAMRKSHTVLISRDPYTRLYSAYVDKILLPPQPMKTKFDDVTCGNQLTFEKFLQEISKTANKGIGFNQHWAPIVSLCDPCSVNPFAVVKLEFFSTDVEHILENVGVAPDEFEVIQGALHDHRIESTIPGIVRTILSMKLVCETKMDVAKDLWLSFQIQGYIRDDVSFPVEKIKSEEYVNREFLTDVILETIRINPISPEECKEQRHHYLVKAYQNIDRKTVEDIQNLYKKDFMVFDYDFEPPS